jgi:hypothetical protein
MEAKRINRQEDPIFGAGWTVHLLPKPGAYFTSTTKTGEPLGRLPIEASAVRVKGVPDEVAKQLPDQPDGVLLDAVFPRVPGLEGVHAVGNFTLRFAEIGGNSYSVTGGYFREVPATRLAQ